MALRNISNIPPQMAGSVYTTELQQNCQQPLIAKTRKLTTNPSRARIVNTKPQQQYQQVPMNHQYYKPQSLNYAVPVPIQSQCQSNPKPQIRTSSPISSSTSDSFDAPPDGVFPGVAMKHMSIKELAYEKLRQQNQKLAASNPAQVNPVRSNGKLKLVAYNNFGHLTVHVVKGKSYRAIGDTYVRIQILPDPHCVYKQYQTSVVKQPKQKSNSSQSSGGSIVYDDKFSFEVDPASTHKNQRVCVSVWCRPSHVPGARHVANSLLSSHSSSSSLGSNSLHSASLSASAGLASDLLVGCFSFRVRSLMGTTVKQAQAQWYHLLPESIGLHKHYRCHRTVSSAAHEDVASAPISHVNRDLIGLERVKFRVGKSHEHDSYGFTVTGNCPCMIGKVDQTKQAFTSGLRPGDFIASLDGKNVSRATCDSVVKLIKSFRNGFDIEVYRDKRHHQKQRAPQQQQQSQQPKLLMKTEVRTTVKTTSTNAVQNENVYYEIPSVRCVERPRINYNLDVVPEEEEENEYGIESVECSDVEYSDEDDYEGDVMEDVHPRAAFMVEDIRHVDSDVNTEEEDHYAAQVRQLSSRYLISSKVTSL